MVLNVIRSKVVCPWWLCCTFDNPMRRFIHNPEAILSHYVKPGDHVIDIGAGMGFFSIPLAKLVGPKGRLTSVDIQKQMLSQLECRAKRHGLSNRITIHLASPNSIGSHNPADFILAFWMVHEVIDQNVFFSEVTKILKPNGHLLLVEPKIHVSRKEFIDTIQIAQDAGMAIAERPNIKFSRSVLLSQR